MWFYYNNVNNVPTYTYSLENSKAKVRPFNVYITILHVHVPPSQMNLGEGPQFIAMEVDSGTVRKLKEMLVPKFHLMDNFFKCSSQDPSERHIILRLSGPISPQDVANINEARSPL